MGVISGFFSLNALKEDRREEQYVVFCKNEEIIFCNYLTNMLKCACYKNMHTLFFERKYKNIWKQSDLTN